MARPEFKNTKVRLESGVEITDQLTAAFWFNIEDEALYEAVKSYYANSKKQPGLQLQKKVGDQYVKVGGGSLFADDGLNMTSPAPAPAPTPGYAPPPPPPPLQEPPWPEAPQGYQGAKNG